MKAAFMAIKKEPVDARKVSWRFTSAALPVSKLYNTKDLKTKIADETLKERDRLQAARQGFLQVRAAGEFQEYARRVDGDAIAFVAPGAQQIDHSFKRAPSGAHALDGHDLGLDGKDRLDLQRRAEPRLSARDPPPAA